MLFIGLMLKNKMFYAASAEKILELCGTFQNYWKLHLFKLFQYIGKGVDYDQSIKNNNYLSDTCEFEV